MTATARIEVAPETTAFRIPSARVKDVHGESPANEDAPSPPAWVGLEADVRELGGDCRRLAERIRRGERARLQLERALQLRDELLAAEPESGTEIARRALAEHVLKADEKLAELERHRESLQARLRHVHARHETELNEFMTRHNIGRPVVPYVRWAQELSARRRAAELTGRPDDPVARDYAELVNRQVAEVVALERSMDGVARDVDAAIEANKRSREVLDADVQVAASDFLAAGVTKLQLLTWNFRPLERAIAEGEDAAVALARVKARLERRLHEAVEEAAR